MTGEEANDTLARRGAPSYLIRFSENKQKYILSLVTNENKFEHYALSEVNQQYALDGADENFPTIDTLLQYYQHKPIDPDKPNTCLGRPCYKKPRMENSPWPTYQSRPLMQTVREEPSQSEVAMQTLVETNKDLIRLLEERIAKQDQMFEKISEKLADKSSCVIS